MERTVIDTIKKLRKEHGLTQEELAKKLFCKRQKITDFERYKSFPSTDEIIALSKIFGVTTDYLLGQSIAKTKDITLQAVCDYTKLSEEAVRRLASCGEEHSDSPNFRAIFNHFVSSGAFVDVFSELGQYLKANVKLEEMQKQVAKLSNEEQLSEVESEQYSKLSNELRHAKKEANFSLFNAQELMSDFVRGLL